MDGKADLETRLNKKKESFNKLTSQHKVSKSYLEAGKVVPKAAQRDWKAAKSIRGLCYQKLPV